MIMATVACIPGFPKRARIAHSPPRLPVLFLEDSAPSLLRWESSEKPGRRVVPKIVRLADITREEVKDCGDRVEEMSRAGAVFFSFSSGRLEGVPIMQVRCYSCLEVISLPDDFPATGPCPACGADALEIIRSAGCDDFQGLDSECSLLGHQEIPDNLF
jgi:predicted RNA-binding Zn-ribbon protein involved in translation (DUF1610 family)